MEEEQLNNYNSNNNNNEYLPSGFYGASVNDSYSEQDEGDGMHNDYDDTSHSIPEGEEVITFIPEIEDDSDHNNNNDDDDHYNDYYHDRNEQTWRNNDPYDSSNYHHHILQRPDETITVSTYVDVLQGEDNDIPSNPYYEEEEYRSNEHTNHLMMQGEEQQQQQHHVVPQDDDEEEEEYQLHSHPRFDQHQEEEQQQHEQQEIDQIPEEHDEVVEQQLYESQQPYQEYHILQEEQDETHEQRLHEQQQEDYFVEQQNEQQQQQEEEEEEEEEHLQEDNYMYEQQETDFEEQQKQQQEDYYNQQLQQEEQQYQQEQQEEQEDEFYVSEDEDHHEENYYTDQQNARDIEEDQHQPSEEILHAQQEYYQYEHQQQYDTQQGEYQNEEQPYVQYQQQEEEEEQQRHVFVLQQQQNDEEHGLQQEDLQDLQQQQQQRFDDSLTSGVFIETGDASASQLDDNSEAFRVAVQAEEDKVLSEFGMIRPSTHESDADSNAEESNANNSIFAESYNGIVQQLDNANAQMADTKINTPETYDNVYIDEIDEDHDGFDEEDPNPSRSHPDNFFPYPTKILVPHVAPSSHSPTKDSTSSPPPPLPEPFLTPRRMNILVASLCFILVASVGVAVGSFLAQQAGKTTPQSSAEIPNVDGSTTPAPTTSPTAAPTKTFEWNEGDCVDHPYKKFNINARFGEQDCAFLRDRPAQRAGMCLPESEGYRWCPVTCGVCDGTLAPTDVPVSRPTPAPTVTALPTVDRMVRTSTPTAEPTEEPTFEPTKSIETDQPTVAPTLPIQPTSSPTTTPASGVRGIIEAALTHSSVSLDDTDSPAGKALEWVVSTSADSSIPDWRIPQLFALAGLAYSAGVDSWLRNGNECSWPGITCESRGRVTGITLRDVGLQGNLFPELYMLSSSLITLNAGQNDLSGRIPSELGLLRQLRLLQIDRNDYSGSIPGSLGNLRNLQVLNLEDNSLTGTVPTSMENLPLRHFRFYFNDLTGSIFESWCRQDNIRLEADCDEVDCPCCSACF